MLAIVIEGATALLALAGLAYLVLALWGARSFAHYWRRKKFVGEFAPDVTLLKPVKGVDPRMFAGFESHCRQEYAGKFEIVFGVSSLDDPAVGEIERLRAEFPECAIRLVECRERLGTSGKVSNLVQMLREARYEHVIINDSDIYVSPRYLSRVMQCFSDENGGDGDLSLYWKDCGEAAWDDVVGSAGGAGDFYGFSAGSSGGAVAGGWDSVWAGVDAGDYEECAGEGRGSGAVGGVSGG